MRGMSVIAITMQYGSGGKEIGAKLAAELQLPLYDGRLSEEAARQSGLSSRLFDTTEFFENGRFSRFSDISASAPVLGIEDVIYVEQARIIREAAERGPCVIVGKGCCKVLEDMPGVLRVFIHADIECRGVRIMDEFSVTKAYAMKLIRTEDRRRNNFLKTYLGNQFSRMEGYHLCIDSGFFDIDGAVRIVKDAYTN